MTDTLFAVPITKSAPTDDGAVYVEGIATNDVLDLDNQIIDRDFARKAMTDWFASWGNIRQMHSDRLAPAGKAVEFEERPEGFWIRAKIVEPTAVKLVLEGVYKAFSIGLNAVRIIRDAIATKGRIVDGFQSELSLVDFPANPTARFSIAKRATPAAPIELVLKHVGAQMTKAHADAPAGIVTVRFTPADLDQRLRRLGKIGGVRVAKRDFDPNTGGGVDRDKVPGQDFVDPERRRFPIVTPQDVADAASSYGRADPKIPFDKFKARLTAIARRKGSSFEAKLPEKWKEGSTTKAIDTTTGAVDADITKGAKDCPNCDKAYDADSSAKHCENCGTKLPTSKAGAADTTKGADAKPGLAAHREPDGDEDGPDVDNDGDGTARKGAYHLRRLHDALCPAYHDDDVLAVHPALATGIPAVVEPAVFGAELRRTLEADAGTGAHAHLLSGLSGAYQLAVHLAGADPELLDLAAADLRKGFAEAYPDAHPRPTDMTPGQFQRGYVSAGRAPLSAPDGQHPRIPLASHVPSAADFQRPLITAGHETEAPASIAKGRTYYTNAARQQAADVLVAMHDYIAKQHPAVCPVAVDAPAASVEPAVANANGSTLTTAVPNTFPMPMPMQATATPTPVSPATANAATLGAVTKTVDAEPAPAGLDQVAAVLHQLLAEHITPISEELSALGKRVGTLESAPDPAAASLRGAATLAALRQAPSTDTPAGRDDKEAAERLVRVVKRAKHPDSGVSVPAYEQLLTMVGPEQAAALLG